MPKNTRYVKQPTVLRMIDRRIRDLEAKVRARAVQRAQALAVYRDKPGDYVRVHLKRTLTPQQESILQLLAQPPYRVLVRSANTVGKTFLAAAKCSHFYDSYHPSITLATAPVAAQVRDLLFAELRRQRPNSRGFLPKESRLQDAPDHYIHGYTAANPDAFQGRHAERLGLLFDEATGVDRRFWSRGETMFESSGKHWWLACYNPNDSSSPAYQAEETGNWHVVHLSALEHPNIAAEIAGLPPVVPGAIRLDTVLRRLAAETEMISESDYDPIAKADFRFSNMHFRPLTPEFQSQILGLWPVAAANALWSPAMFAAACRGRQDVNPAWEVAIGCDVARFGDDRTCIVVRQGVVVLCVETHSSWTTTQIAHRLKQLATEYTDTDRSKQVRIYIDDTGGYGSGVVDQMSDYNAIGLCMSSASPEAKYPNLRSALHCNLAYLAHAGGVALGRLVGDEQAALRQELVATRFTLNSDNQRALVPKAQIKQMLGRSPDRADALAMCYYMYDLSGIGLQ